MQYAAIILALASGSMAQISAAAIPFSNGTQYVTETVSILTTFCPGPTTVYQNSKTYVVTEATTLTIVDCPCTVVKPIVAPYPTVPAGASTVLYTSCPPTVSAQPQAPPAVQTYPVAVPYTNLLTTYPAGVAPPPAVATVATPAPVAPVTQITDGQIQAPTVAPVAPVTQIGDGQLQAPTTVASGAPVTQIGDGQLQVPTAAPSTPVVITNAASGNKVGSFMVGAAALVVLAL